MSKEGKKRAEHQYRQFSNIFFISFLPWSVPEILRAMVQRLNVLTSGDWGPVEVCLGLQVKVNGFPSRAKMLVTCCAGCHNSMWTSHQRSKGYFTAGVESKGQTWTEHLLSLCRLEKSFSWMPKQLTIFHASKNHTNSLYKQKQVLPSVPYMQ